MHMSMAVFHWLWTLFRKAGGSWIIPQLHPTDKCFSYWILSPSHNMAPCALSVPFSLLQASPPREKRREEMDRCPGHEIDQDEPITSVSYSNTTNLVRLRKGCISNGKIERKKSAHAVCQIVCFSDTGPVWSLVRRRLISAVMEGKMVWDK